MRKLAVSMVVVAVAFGSLIGPAEAAKKKKKPKQPVQVDVTYYLRNTADECVDEAYQLLLETADAGSSCGTALSGPGNELLVSAGDVPDTITYNATEALPLILDATKPIKGKIVVLSYRGNAANPGALSAGLTHFVMTLTGTVNGEATELGTFEAEYVVNPAQAAYDVDFEIQPAAELDKGEVTALSAGFYNRGFAPLHGFYQVNASTIVVPTWGQPVS